MDIKQRNRNERIGLAKKIFYTAGLVGAFFLGANYGSTPKRICVVDFNCDSKPDLLVQSVGWQSYVFLNSGNGGYDFGCHYERIGFSEELNSEHVGRIRNKLNLEEN